MKRTVVRWVSKIGLHNLSTGCGAAITKYANAMKTLTYRHPVEISYDDGLPEPEGKCPCENGAHEKELWGCCVGNIPAREPKCCRCHGGSTLCTSPFHAKKPETRDRVVEGYCGFGIKNWPYEHDPRGAIFIYPGTSKSAEELPHSGQDVKVTLIIHEKVKEPTLVEAVEGYLQNRYNPEREAALYEALAREKKAQGGE